MIYPFQDKTPRIAESVYLAPTAVVIGDVILKAQANVWFGAVIRGDLGQIVVGERTSIQDNCVLHVNRQHNTLVGDDVVVGHGVIMEGCTIGNRVMLGMNATILSGVTIGEYVVVGAGSVVREGQTIPSGVLVAGVPAQIKRDLTDIERSRIQKGAQSYLETMQVYATSGIKG